jgi:hypothetical protein
MRLRFPFVSLARLAHRMRLYRAMPFALPLLLAAASRADAPAKAPEVVTALPPAPLSTAQLAAIAAKAAKAAKAAQTVPARPSPAPVKLAHPVLAPPRASAYGISPDAAAKRERLLYPQRALPQVSPALGVIPRPEWNDPFAVKHADVMVIGGHPVSVPGTPVVPPAAVRR